MKEQKPFEYDELFALCFLCAAEAAFIVVKGEFTDEVEGRKAIERKTKEIIAIRWDHPSKG